MCKKKQLVKNSYKPILQKTEHKYHSKLYRYNNFEHRVILLLTHKRQVSHILTNSQVVYIKDVYQ